MCTIPYIDGAGMCFSKFVSHSQVNPAGGENSFEGHFMSCYQRN